ncbi:hypothetical protein [Bacillus sp. CECT 9360]|uniref:hypothetical protein n=1 Tax=Bacillus sp. CECT 9360 TaxID=2845821 RepID=UPI001E3C990C|nr:hypothetical protein [Bacillus sp. CECT 9360]CAH0347107.1 hypothetical protein BCI9360_03480 [Bacillus sp. CECT 9360]
MPTCTAFSFNAKGNHVCKTYYQRKGTGNKNEIPATKVRVSATKRVKPATNRTDSATKPGTGNKNEIPATKVRVSATNESYQQQTGQIRQQNRGSATKMKFRQQKSVFWKQNESNLQQNQNSG